MAEAERLIVAFLGPEGSYTHQAALSAFPPATSSVTISPQPTIEDVFSAVQSGTAFRGVVPFENSSNGSVVFTLDLFADLKRKYPGILVCGEAYVSVKHCLLGHVLNKENERQRNIETAELPVEEENEPAKPLHPISHIKTLYSHPQAWGQCNVFLHKYLKHAERRDVSSTSKAAELVAQDTSGTSAALSSIIAADLFGLDVLAKTINDRVGNTTRFLVIRRADGGADATSTTTASALADATAYKSLVTFTVDHENPGALAGCLSAFSSHGVNLTSINTRPSGLQNWNYIFFVEFQGRKEEEREDCEVNKALKALEGVCSGYRWLGSWESREQEV